MGEFVKANAEVNVCKPAVIPEDHMRDFIWNWI